MMAEGMEFGDGGLGADEMNRSVLDTVADNVAAAEAEGPPPLSARGLKAQHLAKLGVKEGTIEAADPQPSQGTIGDLRGGPDTGHARRETHTSQMSGMSGLTSPVPLTRMMPGPVMVRHPTGHAGVSPLPGRGAGVSPRGLQVPGAGGPGAGVSSMAELDPDGPQMSVSHMNRVGGASRMGSVVSPMQSHIELQSRIAAEASQDGSPAAGGPRLNLHGAHGGSGGNLNPLNRGLSPMNGANLTHSNMSLDPLRAPVEGNLSVGASLRAGASMRGSPTGSRDGLGGEDGIDGTNGPQSGSIADCGKRQDSGSNHYAAKAKVELNPLVDRPRPGRHNLLAPIGGGPLPGLGAGDAARAQDGSPSLKPVRGLGTKPIRIAGPPAGQEIGGGARQTPMGAAANHYMANQATGAGTNHYVNIDGGDLSKASDASPSQPRFVVENDDHHTAIGVGPGQPVRGEQPLVRKTSPQQQGSQDLPAGGSAQASPAVDAAAVPQVTTSNNASPNDYEDDFEDDVELSDGFDDEALSLELP